MRRIKFPMHKQLTWLGLVAPALCCEPSSVRADVQFLGVAAGDATDTDAVVWTRAVDTNAPSAATLAIQLAPNDPTLTSGAVIGIVSTDPAKDYTAKLAVTNLLAGTRYYYRFLNAANPANGSIIGTFKTAPSPDAAAPVHMAFSGDC